MLCQGEGNPIVVAGKLMDAGEIVKVGVPEAGIKATEKLDGACASWGWKGDVGGARLKSAVILSVGLLAR